MKLLLVLLSLWANTVQAEVLYPLPTPQQTSQFQHLLKELRCLVCQNQDIADSNAALANDLRNEVYELVRAGKSDHDIIDYLTTRYGDFIMFNPPLKPITVLLWFAPFLFVGVGLIVFGRRFTQREFATS